MAMTVEYLARRSRALFPRRSYFGACAKSGTDHRRGGGHDQEWIDQQLKEFNAIAQNYLLS